MYKLRTAFVCCAAAATASAQLDTPAPTFSTATKLVQVDVIARSQGAPVAGLTKKDFTVLDNGNPQKKSPSFRPGRRGLLEPLPATQGATR